MGLKEEYASLEAERNENIKKLNEIMEDEKVKQFFELRKLVDNQFEELKDLYHDMKHEEYSACNHIWITSYRDIDYYEGRSHAYHGCVKCGLDETVFYLKSIMDGLTPYEQVMYDYLYKHNFPNGGIYIEEICDLELGMAIYRKIKEAHPEADDSVLINYFKYALHKMRENKNNQASMENRARRLALSSDFKKW